MRPERPWELDAAGAERFAKRVAAARVGGSDLLRTIRLTGVAPDPNDQPLEEMGHPSGGKQAATFDARHRGRVTRHDGETQVRSQRLRNRPEMRPASPPRLTQRVAWTFCDVEGVIIFEHQHPRMAGEHRTELVGSFGVDRGTVRVLSTRCESACDGAGAQRPGETLGGRTTVIDRHREHGQTERGREIDHSGVAGVLDGDPIAGTEVSEERELNAIERTPDDGQMIARHAVTVETGRRQGEQLGVGARGPIQNRLVGQLDERGREIGQKRRVRVAGEQVDDTGRHDRPAARRRRDTRGNGGAEPAGPGDESTTAQLPVRGRDGRGADPAMGGERSDGRQTRPSGELAVADATLDALRDLRRPSPGDVITYRYVHRFVL